MLLPQSSAFAALKNRLNSVSAIGYLHIAPRTYVPCLTSRQKSANSHTISPSSNPASSSVSSFERPNRLKARDEGGMRWSELLDKFKSVQEKARRAQRLANSSAAGFDLGDDVEAFQEKAKLQAAAGLQQGSKPPALGARPNSAGNAARPTQHPPPTQGHQKSKSSLSNLGRFTSGVGARKTKR